MNRVYRIVWCCSRNAYVVASELASRKKIKGRKTSLINSYKKSIFLTALVAILTAQGLSFAEIKLSEEEQEVLSVDVMNIPIPVDLELLAVADTGLQDEETDSEDGEDGRKKRDRSLLNLFKPAPNVEPYVDYSSGIILGDDIYTGSTLQQTMVVIGNEASNFDEYSVVVGYKAEGEAIGVVALGHESKAYGNNSVAIGAGSVANDDNSVSIGHGEGESKERLLTGLSSGQVTRRSIDAINGSQFYEAMTSINNAFGGGGRILTTGVMTEPNFKGALKADEDINTVYKGFEYLTGKLDGVGGGLLKVEGTTIIIDNEAAKDVVEVDISDEGTARKLTGVDTGLISATSTEAINGGQLHSVNSSIATALGGDAAVNADGMIKVPQYDFNKDNDTDPDLIFNNVGDALTNIDGRVYKNSGDITLIQEDITLISDDIEGLTQGTAGLIQLDGTKIVVNNDLAKNVTDFDISNEGNARKLTGVDTGLISETSTEVINGSQLHAVNSSIATALGGDAAVNADGAIKAPQYDFNKDNDTDPDLIFGNVGDALTNIDRRVYKNSGDITLIQEDITLMNDDIEGLTQGTAGLIQLDGTKIVVNNDLAKNATELDISNDGDVRKLTGVGVGLVGAISVEAINGSQLYGSLESINSALGGSSTINPDGKINAPNFKGALGADEDIQTVYKGFEYLTGKLEGVGGGGLFKLEGTKIVVDNNQAKNATVFDISNDGDARKLVGVDTGLISETSTEVINGSQLHAVNSSIATALGGDAAVNADGTIKAPQYDFNKDNDTDPDLIFGNVGDALTNIDGRVYKNSGDITLIQEDITLMNDDIEGLTQGTAGLIQLDGTKIVVNNDLAKNVTDFDISNEGVARKLVGIDTGEVSEVSTEAINGGQLHAANSSIAKALGGDAEINADGTIKAPQYDFNKEGATDPDKIFNNVGDALTNLDGRVYQNSHDILLIDNKIKDFNAGTAGLFRINGSQIVIDNTVAKDVSILNIANNDQSRTIKGITDGLISETSTEAINGSQLHTTNKEITKNSGGISDLAEALGGGALINADGELEGPNYTFVDGTTHTNVGSALGDLDSRVDGLDSKFGGLENKVEGLEGKIEGINNGTAGVIQVDTDAQGKSEIKINNDIAGNADTLNIAKADGERTLTGVADGTISDTSKDAVNAGQIYGMAEDLGRILGTDVSIDDNGFVYVNSSFNVGQQNPTDFTVSGALQHLKNQISESEGQGLFAYDEDKNQIILADNGKINAETTVDFGSRKVGGVVAVEPTRDSEYAVNGHQLWETNQKVDYNTQQIAHINNTLGHYNARITQVERTVHQNRKVASAGISSAMAMSSIPYVENMKYSFGMGAAGYDGEAAMSMGFSFKIGSDARVKIQGSYDTQNKVGVGIGFAYGF